MGTAAAAWFAVCFFVLPGFLVNWVAGLKAPAAMAGALPVTFGVVGMAAWFWGLVRAPFGLFTFALSVIGALCVAGAWRYLFARRARGQEVSWRRALFPGSGAQRRRRSIADPYWILPAVGVVAGAATIISDRLSWLVRTPNGVMNIVQGWDVQWHANLVRFIMDEGVASPTRMGELLNVETHAGQLYPSAYHAGVALYAEAAGLEPIPALNVASTVLPGIAFPVSMACLVFAFLRSTGLTAQIAAGLAAIFVYALPQVLWVPEYVGMWPYLFAIGLTGMVVWQFVSVPDARAGALSAGIGFLGVLCVHPSAVTVVVLAVVLFWLTSTLVRPSHSRVGDTVWMALPALVASIVFLPQVLAGADQASEVAGWQPRDLKSSGSAWGTALWMETRHVEDFFPGFDATVWLWLAGAGALVMVLWRFQVWPVLFYVVSLAAAAHALEPIDNWFGYVVAVVANLHYNTAHRLIMPVAMSVVAAAAIAVAAAIRLVTLAPAAERYQRHIKASAAASAALALVAGAVAVPQVRAAAETGAKAAFEAPRTIDRMVNADDLAAFDWLANQPAAHEGVTMGDPADGHSWLYAYAGVPTVSRHYQSAVAGIGSATETLLRHADFIGEQTVSKRNPADRAVEELDVRFFIVSPGSFWSHQLPRYDMLRAPWVSEGLTPVYSKGDTAIFAVNSAFSKAELKAMRKDALQHGSDKLPKLENAADLLANQAGQAARPAW
ncbi:hypothetical protein A0K93_09305 [Corynebacterium sp. BCW_4722]|nr:hypothetical protein A0K93_09305 [Corynebacterium sp. BCW_4722]